MLVLKASGLRSRLRQCEGKIAMLTVINSALQKENEELRRSAARAPASHTEEELKVRRSGSCLGGRSSGVRLGTWTALSRTFLRAFRTGACARYAVSKEATPVCMRRSCRRSLRGD